MALYIAHSNIKAPVKLQVDKPPKKVSAADQFAYEMAVKFRKNALKKYAAEIAEIKEYFPDWKPTFGEK